MIIIADTSALIALAICDGLKLLEQLFDQIAVPQTVYDECIIPEKSESVLLEQFLKHRIVILQRPSSLDLPSYLGKGEVEAMLLYKELNADYLLVDDNRARKVAKINQIKIIGSLGILLLSKKKEKIEKVTPYLEKLRHSDIYLDDNLLQEILKLADE